MITPLIILFIANLVVWFSSEAFACSVCFKGKENDPTTIGLQSAIWFMLGLLSFIGIVLIKFFISVSKRSKLTQ